MNIAWLLLGNALVLGFRHGIDWDHIAAIMDIVGTVTADGALSRDGTLVLQRRALRLSSLYALGHAFVVIILGLLALQFSSLLPAAVGPIMERFVGITLLGFGICVIYFVLRYLTGKSEFVVRSRWLMLFEIVQKSGQFLARRIFKSTKEPSPVLKQYGSRTAFSVGMLHGVGAETGTQILLLAGVGGQSNHMLGLEMLLAFVIGSLFSNTIIAVLGACGFIASTYVKQLYVLTGAFTGLFSLVVGLYFTLGMSERLPDIQQLLSGLG